MRWLLSGLVSMPRSWSNADANRYFHSDPNRYFHSDAYESAAVDSHSYSNFDFDTNADTNADANTHLFARLHQRSERIRILLRHQSRFLCLRLFLSGLV